MATKTPESHSSRSVHPLLSQLLRENDKLKATAIKARAELMNGGIR